MRRILLVLSVAALMAVMLALSVGPAAADTPNDNSAFHTADYNKDPTPGLDNSNIAQACNGIVPAMNNTNPSLPPSTIYNDIANVPTINSTNCLV